MKLKNLLQNNITLILSGLSLITCFSVVIWTLNVIQTIKCNDLARAAKDELILRKLENFSNMQHNVLEKMNKMDTLSPLPIELPQKLAELPSIEAVPSLLNDPTLLFLGITLLIFTISCTGIHRERGLCSLTRSRLNQERGRLELERIDLSHQKDSFIVAKNRYDAQHASILETAAQMAQTEESATTSAIKNIDENLKKINSSFTPVETFSVETQTDFYSTFMNSPSVNGLEIVENPNSISTSSSLSDLFVDSLS